MLQVSEEAANVAKCRAYGVQWFFPCGLLCLHFMRTSPLEPTEHKLSDWNTARLLRWPYAPTPLAGPTALFWPRVPPPTNLRIKLRTALTSRRGSNSSPPLPSLRLHAWPSHSIDALDSGSCSLSPSCRSCKSSNLMQKEQARPCVSARSNPEAIAPIPGERDGLMGTGLWGLRVQKR